MLVQRVAMPATGAESWSVLGDDDAVVPVERYLAYLTDVERSPNTVKAHAHDLKGYWTFLTPRGRASRNDTMPITPDVDPERHIRPAEG